MIGYLNGTILDTDGKKAILLTENGVGYEINFGYFLKKHHKAEIFIHHHISENDQSLWGFNTLTDKKMFELLKTVNKVGSSKAYPLITTIGTQGLIEAIMFEQAAVLTKAPGIGKKMAEQIILSLKDKIEKFNASENAAAGLPLEPISNDIKVDDTQTKVFQEVLLALESLGYKDASMNTLVKKQLSAGFNSSEEIIKNVLREL